MHVHVSMHMADIAKIARGADSVSAAKCLQDGHNPRNNFVFDALIWVAGNIPVRPGGF